LPRNLSVTANFLRPQTGFKKETPPGGAGKILLEGLISILYLHFFKVQHE